MKGDKLISFEEDGILNIEKIINRYNSYIYTILKNSLSKDIAKILKISESKTKVSLYRTRKVINKKLKERGYGYEK